MSRQYEVAIYLSKQSVIENIELNEYVSLTSRSKWSVSFNCPANAEPV
jgi:hypothetical protein